MPKYGAVVFDLYGTLMYFIKRTRPFHRLITDLQLTEEQLKMAGRSALTRNFNSISEFAQVLKPDHKLNLADYEKDVQEELKNAVLYPETIETLEKLRKENISIGCISNLGSAYKMPYFVHHLDLFIDEVVFSCDAGFRKPEPQIYHEMLKKLKIPPEKILMTGDTYAADVEGPKKVGMNAVFLDRNDESTVNPKIKYLDQIIDYVI